MIPRRTTIKRLQQRLYRKAKERPTTEHHKAQIDQCYGASEALRWVLGEGPSLNSWSR